MGDSAHEFLVADDDQPGGVNVIIKIIHHLNVNVNMDPQHILIPPVSTGVWMFHIVF